MSQTEAIPATPAHPWAPYVAPIATYLVLTSLEGYLPRLNGQVHPTYYPLAYAGKIAVVSILLVVFRSTWRDLKPWPGAGGWALAVVVGIIIAAGWIGLERVPYPKLGGVVAGERPAFNPFVTPPPARAAFLAVRFFGLAVMVPLMEELFWRSFLMRLIIDPDTDFQRVPVGRVTPAAAAITSALFAAAHPEWLPALLTGLAWAGLLAHTGSLAACVASHAVANLGLGLYVVATGHWKLW